MQPSFLYVILSIETHFLLTKIKTMHERQPFLDFPLTAKGDMSSQQSSLTVALQDNLTLEDKPPADKGSMRPPPRRTNTGETMPPPYSKSSRGENVPPRGPPGHRPSRSQEEAMRARRLAGGPSSSRKPRPTGELDIFADPGEGSSTRRHPEGRRVRRNSDSSVADRKPLDPEEEKKRQERKRRERERRHREREEKDPKSKKPDRKLDVIDKLDVTSIFGTGRKCCRFDLRRPVTDSGQSSITMGHLMRAILIETDKEADVRPCRLFPKTR
jgi:hypothetical protein